MKKLPGRVFLACCILIFSVSATIAQQVADEDFNYPISEPMYKGGEGPLIIFDEAHNNSSTLRGAYSAFNKSFN